MPDAFHVPFSTLSRVVHTHRRLPGPATVWLAAWLLTSCAAFRHRPHPAADSDPTAKPPRPAALAANAMTPTAMLTPAVHRVGTVRVIGDAQRFVLVEVPPSATGALPDGQLLRCATDPTATATAILRVGRERRRPYVVADVVSGEPRVGDTVFTTVADATPAANTGPLVLPTATSGVLPIALPDATPASGNPHP